MSDYVFTSMRQQKGRLIDAIQNIYIDNPPHIREFHGLWGSLAVSSGHYRGFQPYENDEHLMVVIGGPVLYFRNNSFLVKEDSNVATEAIYKRWMIDRAILWDEDLSGPFTVLLVDKKAASVTVVTDLMAFIPVYICKKERVCYLGTHVDAVAKVAGEEELLDDVSMADFIINDAVTFPYTAYERVRQLPPSSVIDNASELDHKTYSYWQPEESNPYESIHAAATSLRDGIRSYVERITEEMTEVAHFISAGEDSRAISGMLPERLKRNAFIFLDKMNREGKIAIEVARAYGSKLSIGYRSSTHYIDILPEARRLVGSGHQYIHAHSLGFHKDYSLASYQAVFGGYLADALLKARFSRRYRGTNRLPFLPELTRPGEARTSLQTSDLIQDIVLKQINKRRIDRFSAVQAERGRTAHEWFVLRPATMRVAIPNLYTTRRLFRSYEPFMCKEAVKISAAVPTAWKLNRRLFQKAVKPYLRRSKWIPHADGRLPYFNWWVNFPLQLTVWVFRQMAERVGYAKGNQGPWADYAALTRSAEWNDLVDQIDSASFRPGFIREEISFKDYFSRGDVSINTKFNILQCLVRK